MKSHTALPGTNSVHPSQERLMRNVMLDEKNEREREIEPSAKHVAAGKEKF